MNIHNSIIRDEVKELEHEMSVAELLDHIDSDNILIAIQIVLEEIALERIIDRTQEFKEIEKKVDNNEIPRWIKLIFIGQSICTLIMLVIHFLK